MLKISKEILRIPSLFHLPSTRPPPAADGVAVGGFAGGYDQGYQVSPSDVNGKFGKKCVGVGSISELSSAANSRKSAEMTENPHFP